MTAPASHDTDRAALRGDAERALVALVGNADARLRDDQWVAIEALVADRRRALVVQRTGWGKSAVYFVATALLRARGAGPTVLISPLLALMRNQVAAAARAGIRAETINSANVTEWAAVHERIAAGEVDVLLVSPERLNNPAFRDQVLPRLAADAGLVVIDEAHCISDWGHDFRPDYRRIRTLLADLPDGIPVLATTATANARVTADVAEQLAVRSSAHAAAPDSARDLEDVLVLRGSLDRESLHLAVATLPDTSAQLAWLTHNLPRIEGSGIVYCLTVAAAQQVTEHLRGAGLDVRAYTGQTDPAERELAEADLLANRVKALVATSALGMGFDKGDLAFVVHLGAPPSPIAYYQQVGRAGRAAEQAGGQAMAVLLPGREDRAIWDYFASMAFPAQDDVRATLAALEAHGKLSTAALETHVSLRRNRLELMLKVLDVDGAVRRVTGGWQSTGEPWAYDADRYERVAAARSAEQQSMVDYVRGDTCRMAFLRRALDDPDLAGPDGAAWRCGRCDVCGGASAGSAPDEREVADARERMAVPGIEVEPRKMWPSGMASLGVDLSGRLAAGDRAETGRAVARLDGIGWGGLLRDVFATGPDGAPTHTDEMPVPLRAPVLEVLAAWRPDPAPVGIVVIESATRPGLVRHLADGVARTLGLPVVGSIRPRGDLPPGRHDVNSAQRLAGVVHRLELDLSEAAAAGLPGRAVILVDDRTDSGWTLTVATRLLRRAGASAVHPFVLGVG